MHEHGSEEGHRITEGIGKEAGWNESPFSNEGVAASQLYKEEQDVQSDQGIRDQRNRSARGIVITDWKHGVYLLQSRLDLSQLHDRMSPAILKERDLLAVNSRLELKEMRPTALS